MSNIKGIKFNENLKNLQELKQDEVWYNDEDEKTQIESKAKFGYYPLFIIESMSYVKEIYSKYNSIIKNANNELNTLYASKILTLTDGEIVRTIYFVNDAIKQYLPSNNELGEIIAIVKNMTNPKNPKQQNIALYKVLSDTTIQTVCAPIAPMRNFGKQDKLSVKIALEGKPVAKKQQKVYPTHFYAYGLSPTTEKDKQAQKLADNPIKKSSTTTEQNPDSKQAQEIMQRYRNYEQKPQSEVQKNLSRMQEWAEQKYGNKSSELDDMYNFMASYAKYIKAKEQRREYAKKYNATRRAKKQSLNAQSQPKESNIQQKQESKQRQASQPSQNISTTKNQQLNTTSDTDSNTQEEHHTQIKQAPSSPTKPYKPTRKDLKTEKEIQTTLYKIATNIEKEIAREEKLAVKREKDKEYQKEKRARNKEKFANLPEEEKEKIREKQRVWWHNAYQRKKERKQQIEALGYITTYADATEVESELLFAEIARNIALTQQRALGRKRKQQERERKAQMVEQMSPEEKEIFFAEQKAKNAKYRQTTKQNAEKRLENLSTEELEELELDKKEKRRIHNAKQRKKEKERVANMLPEEFLAYQEKIKEQNRQKNLRRKEKEAEKLSQMTEEEKAEYLEAKRNKNAEYARNQRERQKEKVRNMSVPEKTEYIEKKREKQREANKRYYDKKKLENSQKQEQAKCEQPNLE